MCCASSSGGQSLARPRIEVPRNARGNDEARTQPSCKQFVHTSSFGMLRVLLEATHVEKHQDQHPRHHTTATATEPVGEHSAPTASSRLNCCRHWCQDSISRACSATHDADASLAVHGLFIRYDADVPSSFDTVRMGRVVLLPEHTPRH